MKSNVRLRSFDRKKTFISTRTIIKTSDVAIPIRNSGKAVLTIDFKERFHGKYCRKLLDHD
jgi:hypothetical protein